MPKSNTNVNHYQLKTEEEGKKAWLAWLTLVHIIIGHDGDTLLPHHADIGPIAVARPEEHWQQNGLNDGAPQHTQNHPVVGAIELEAGKAHHLDGTRKRCGNQQLTASLYL